jgi:molecular chaperone DnaK
MAKDAESHAAEDRTLRDTIEAKNKADAMVYNVEKTLKEHRSKIGEAVAKEIEAALEETRKAIGENDPARITSAVDRLTTASHKLAEAMYKAAPPEPGTQEPPSANGTHNGAGTPNDNVVDAEFVDVGK